MTEQRSLADLIQVKRCSSEDLDRLFTEHDVMMKTKAIQQVPTVTSPSNSHH